MEESNSEKNVHSEKSTLCLLIGAFRPLTVKVINDKYIPIAIFILCFPVFVVLLCLLFSHVVV